MDPGRRSGQLLLGEGAASLEAWRRAILDRILLLTLCILVVAAIMSSREIVHGQQFMFAAILLGTTIVAAAAFWRSLDSRLRMLAFAIGMGIACVGSVIPAGFLLPNAFTGFVALEVVLALLAGQRAAWAAFGASMVFLLLVAGSRIQGGVAPDAATYDVTLASNWLRVLVVFSALSAALLGTVAYLTRKLEGALLHSQDLLAELRTESSEKIQALEERQQLTEQLRQSQKLESLGQLAGGVAHDFNNLLSVILGYSDLAKKQATDPELRGLLDEINEATGRAAALTNQLLTFSRHQIAAPGRVDVNASVESALKLIRRLLPSSISIDVALGESVGQVWGAGIEIEQVLMNLCINARDAMPDGGRLRIHTDRLEDDGAPWVRLWVSDDGAGMTVDEAERIFEPFFTTKDATSGTGLGLSVVHGIVMSYGGRIEVDSQPGKGSTFSIRLPLHIGDETVDALAPVPAGPTEMRDSTILVVDDDATVRRMIGRLLEKAGHAVVLCSDGEEAMSRFAERAGEVSLVVTDSVMPRMGGAALHDELSKQNPSLPILMCSGYTAGRLSSAFFDHPLRDFLPKPFTERDLLERVERLLTPVET